MIDTRPLFRPLRDEMVTMLRRLHDDDTAPRFAMRSALALSRTHDGCARYSTSPYMHVWSDVPARAGVSVLIRVTGPAAGNWTLRYREGQWRLEPGVAGAPATTVTLAGEVAWRLFFNALSAADARPLIDVRGDAALALPLLRTRAVIV